MDDRNDSAAALTAALIAEETTRSEQDPAPVVERLAGVGGEAISIRQAVQVGGVGMLGLMFGLNLVDEWPRVAGLALAPDIQETFGIFRQMGILRYDGATNTSSSTGEVIELDY